MRVDPSLLLLFLAMGAVTYGTRIAGLLVSDKLKLSHRGREAFNAIPAAVLISVIAPTALATGWPETLAAVVTAFAALRLPLLATIATGVAAVVLLRQLLG